MDFAIIEVKGKQYKITSECSIEIEHLVGEAGAKVLLDKVLMIVDGDNVEIGAPYLEGKSFEAEIEEQKKGKKIKILRFRAKSRHRRRVGFRPKFTRLTLGKKAKGEVKGKEKEIKKETVEVKTKITKKETKKTSVKTPAKKIAKKSEK